MSAFSDWLKEAAATTTALFRETLADADKNVCIEWCRAQVEVLDRLGVKSRPVPVDVMAGNRAADLQLLYNTPLTPAATAAGAWTVGVDHRVNSGGRGWDGHLVVAVVNPAGGRILLDGTADQFSRPQHDIVVPPIIMLELPPVWDRPVYTNPKLHSGIVRYRPMPPGAAAAKVWRDSAAWNNPNLPAIADTAARYLTKWVDVAA